MTSILDKYYEEVTKAKAVVSREVCLMIKAPNPRFKNNFSHMM